MRLATLEGMGKRENKYVGRLDKVLLIRVTLPPLDRYIICQLASRLSILPTTSSQMNLALKGAPNGSPRYFIGREETPQPNTPAGSSRLSTAPKILYRFEVGDGSNVGVWHDVWCGEQPLMVVFGVV